MKNITITLEADVARWTRIKAAEREKSVSRFVGEVLRERMIEERSYERAMESFLAQSPRALRQPGAKYPRREHLHER